MTPARILVGSVRPELFLGNPSRGAEVLFRTPGGMTVQEEGPNAVLVVLGPDQRPREVAETILWAMR